MSNAFKSCPCCRRACPKDDRTGFCPSCKKAGCAKGTYGRFNRGKACPVKERCARASASRRAG